MTDYTHEWKCVQCGRWSPDLETQTRCAHERCQTARPDVAEYRKVRRSKKAPPAGASYSTRVKLGELDAFLRRIAAGARPAQAGDIQWVCDRCATVHHTSVSFCPECGATRPVSAELRIKAPVRWPRMGLLLGVAGSALLWWQVGGWAALGAFLIVWGDNLGRGR